MPFSGNTYRIGGTAILLFLFVVGGCAKRHITPATISTPQAASQGDPAHDARARLLKEAHRAFVQERYASAALFFNRYVDIVTDSPRLAEARWWLGRTYEQLGDYEAAMSEYRMVTTGQFEQQANGRSYESHALRRLDELRRLHVDRRNDHAKKVALRISAVEVPAGTSLATWLVELVQSGVTALIIEPAPDRVSGVAVAHGESVQTVIDEAHRAGLLVWLALDSHQGSGIKLESEWMGSTVGNGKKARVPTNRPDISHPAYQDHLESLARILSLAGWDGLVLTARLSPGFSDEFSKGSFGTFAALHGTNLSPEEVFPLRLGGSAGHERHELYWRWVGWKARSYVKLAVRMGNAMKEANPTATLLVEIHQSTVSDPLKGLERHGEDLAELNARAGGAVIVRRESPGGSVEAFEQQDLVTNDRAWIALSLRSSVNLLTTDDLAQTIRDAADAGPWKNLLLQTEPSSAIP